MSACFTETPGDPRSNLQKFQFAIPHHQPWTRKEFSWKNCWGLCVYFVTSCISCWGTDLGSLLQVISVNSKGLIPSTCQGNSSDTEERGTWELGTWEHILHSFPLPYQNILGLIYSRSIPWLLESSLERTPSTCTSVRAVIP